MQEREPATEAGTFTKLREREREREREENEGSRLKDMFHFITYTTLLYTSRNLRPRIEGASEFRYLSYQ